MKKNENIITMKRNYKNLEVYKINILKIEVLKNINIFIRVWVLLLIILVKLLNYNTIIMDKTQAP